jgi:hypothetical protein
MNPAALRNKILSEMRGGPATRPTSAPGVKVYQRLSSVIDPQSENEIEKLLGEPARVEIEVSFGSYKPDDPPGSGSNDSPGKGFFTPGLFSAYQFEALIHDLTLITAPRIYNDRTEIMQNEHIRKIVNFTSDPENPTVTYQKKYRPKDAFVENKIWGYRVSKSTEEFTDEPDHDFVPDLIRHRRRHSFVIRDSQSGMYGFQFDLSHIKEVKMKQVTIETELTVEEVAAVSAEAEYEVEEGEVVIKNKTRMVEDRTFIKYEVEIERVSSIAAAQSISLENLANAISFVLLSIQDVRTVDDLMTMEEIRDVVKTHNALFAVDIEKTKAKMNNPYRMFKDYWNKPTNISVDDLLDTRINDPWPKGLSVTVKLDGIRQFLLISRNGTYALGPPTDVARIDLGIAKLDGTLLDTERYIDQTTGKITYLAFDILFNRGASVRAAYFHERLALLETIVDQIEAEKTDLGYEVVKKHFYTKGTVYEKATQALKWIEDNPNFSSDGLIFQPSHWYKNNHTKKWKPAEQLTIDFLFKRAEGDVPYYVLYVSDKKGDVPFEGTNRYPYNEMVYVENGLFENNMVDGSIVECKWDPNEGEGGNFFIYRIRMDRDRPNAYATARDVWNDIMDPITRSTIEGDSLRVMRRYHNIMKNNILKAEFASGARIMDWGSGRGGDLGKWAEIGFEKVYVVEPNESNLEELERRLAQTKTTKGGKKLDVEICRGGLDDRLLGGEDTDELLRCVSNVSKEEKLDGIVAFFSLTFFGRDQERWEGMLDSFDMLLENGGKVVGIVMDGARTRKLLDDTRKQQHLSAEEAVDYTNTSFMISQMSEFGTSKSAEDILLEEVVEEKQDIILDETQEENEEKKKEMERLLDISKSGLPNTPPKEANSGGKWIEGPGDEIEIKIFEETSMVRGEGASGGQQEWLFYFDKFKDDMKARGFQIHRDGFLDANPRERTAFDVLAPDSKAFSRLNRFFVFSRRARGGGEKKGVGEKSIKLLNPDEMIAFHTIPGVKLSTNEETSEGVDLYRIGTIRDPSNFIHAIIRAFDQSYYDMTPSEKKAHVKKIRGVLGRKLTMAIYETLNDGEIAARYKSVAIKDLVGEGEKNPDDTTATDLGFLEYRLRVMDTDMHISDESVLELVSKLLGVNIIMLKLDGRPRVKFHGARDFEYMRDVFYKYPKTILVTSPDGVHYDLVAKVVVIESEEEPAIYTVFSSDDALIKYMISTLEE